MYEYQNIIVPKNWVLLKMYWKKFEQFNGFYSLRENQKNLAM